LVDVIDNKLATKVAAAKESVRGAQIDTTGLGIKVPPGFDICVFESQADDYRRGNHTVEPYTATVGDRTYAVAFVRYGEPASIVEAVLKHVIFPKPGEAQEAT
jgi:hypothetical protein